MKTVPYSWDDIFIRCQEIAAEYREKKIDYIFGVTTGGIIPAFVIACLMKKDYLYSNLRPSKEKMNIRGVPDILIIDDILDTGKTKKIVTKMFNKSCKIHFEILFRAKKGTWCVFPWESSQDKPLTRQQKYE